MKEKRLFLCSSCTQDITFVHFGKIKITLKKKKERKAVETRSILSQRRKKKGGGHWYPAIINQHYLPTYQDPPFSPFLYQVFKTQLSISPSTANSLLCYTPIFWYPIFARFAIQEGISHLEKSIIKNSALRVFALAMRQVTGLISFPGRIAWVRLLM